jgi:hypothetical protein
MHFSHQPGLATQMSVPDHLAPAAAIVPLVSGSSAGSIEQAPIGGCGRALQAEIEEIARMLYALRLKVEAGQ